MIFQCITFKMLQKIFLICMFVMLYLYVLHCNKTYSLSLSLSLSLPMDTKLHLTLYNICNYLSMPGLKLNHVSKRGSWCPTGTRHYLVTHLITRESSYWKACFKFMLCRKNRSLTLNPFLANGWHFCNQPTWYVMLPEICRLYQTEVKDFEKHPISTHHFMTY